ncbi:dual specificity protein phosphatase 19-like [Mya arenaria]|uniref:dual specificity protein phosphatase 19-like n=1 Tax=Mya arenaria TaxID=6604 RepID=UPI0022E18DBE|nr:dual specificity protein phosphatase 19-like [Mya arenaria]XP_052813538.1 dual specificity protein phosphatase 19-like [Mya arenaria]XP_052813545.1 dual specificity protein phosphatase 19-like [Mya arenaria]
MASKNSETPENTKPDLLAQLKGFDKKKLHQTETFVKTEDGRVLKETRDKGGQYSATVTDKGQLGFVPEKHGDLQVGEIRSNLLIGSQDVAADIDILKSIKVTHVLNLASAVPNFFPETITYLKLEVLDLIDEPVLNLFDNVFKFIDEGRDKGCVLIHCNAGVSRASTFVIAYLMRTENMTLYQAFKYVKSKREKIQPNAGFLEQLRKYNEFLGYGKSEM